MKPDNEHDADARFLAALVAYDEALAAGREPENLPPMPDSAGDARLRRVQASLELLEQIWPRKSTPPIQPDETPSVPRNRGAENNGAKNNGGEEALFGLLEPGGDPPAHLNGQLNGQLSLASILRTRFQVQREIGSGGGGVVFLARDLRLGRQVALKMPRAEALFTPELRQRFHLEAQVAAGLDHPNIVPVFESGEIGPFCYIATVYCEGPDLRHWLQERQSREGMAESGSACSDTVHSLEVSTGAASETVPMTRGATRDARPVPVRAAAELVRTLADAVHYTHGRGILHRDLKPANILLVPKRSSAEPAQSPVDASRSESGTPLPAFDLDCYTPRITDFGLARWEDGGQQRTKSGLLLGTPAYMAPEQAAGRIREIGAATDVYALGTILYELLTGRPPLEESSEADTLAKILSEEPLSPRRRADVPADLNSICLKCLEKAPSQRYATAAALADDLRRFLACEPTLARPLSAVQRARRFVRRKPAISALAGVSATAVVCLLGLGAWHLVELAHYNKSLVEMVAREREQTAQLTRERDRASRSDNLARAHAYVGRIQLAEEYREDGHVKSMADLLQREWPANGRQDLRGFEWHYLWRLCQSEAFPLRGHAGHVYGIGFSPDGKSLTSIGADETLRVWNIAGDCTVTSRRSVRGISPEIVWSTNGRTLAYISEDDHGKHILSAADVVGGKKLGTWTVRPNPYSLATSGNGRTLAYISEDDHGKHILSAADVVSGKKLGTWTVRPNPYSLAISGNGRFLAASDVSPDRSEVHLWDVQTGSQVTRTFGSHVTAVAFLERDTRLAAVPSKGAFYWSWPVEGSEAEVRIHDLHDSPAPIGSPVFAPGGKSLAGIPDGGNILVWDTATLKLRAEIARRGTDGEDPPQVNNIVFSSDGLALAVGTIDGLEIWGLGPDEAHARFERPGLDVISAAFTADGNTIACGCRAGDIWLWREWNSHRKPPTLTGHGAEAWCVAFSQDGRTLASGGDDHFVRIWDLASGQERCTLESHGSLVTALSWSKDGRTLASSSFDATVKLWDTATWRERVTLLGHEGAVRACAISPDNKTVASAGDDQAARLWNAATGKLRFVLSGHTDKLLCLAFTPNGKTVATGGNDRTIRLWRTSDGRLMRTLREPNSVLSIAFSPDGRIMATGGKGGIVRLLDATSNRVVGTLKSHEQSVRSLIFSPDGKTLATAGEDHSVKLWNVTTAQQLLTLWEGEHQVNALAFSRDGQSLAAALHDGAIKLWTTGTDGASVAGPGGHEGIVRRGVATGSTTAE